MTPLRLVLRCAAIVATVSVVSLLGWLTIWRVLVVQPVAEALLVMPLTALACLLLAAALALPIDRWRGACAGTVTLLGVLVFGEYLFNVGEIERYFFDTATREVLGGPYPGRPSPETALTLVFLGSALLMARAPRGRGFEAPDVGAGAAAFLSGAVFMNHVFRAAAGAWAPGPALNMTLVEAALLLTLAIATLALNPAGIVAAYTAHDERGVARRRLLPAVLLAPLALGVLLQEVLRARLLEMPLAIALVVATVSLVMMVLMEWGTQLFSEIEAQNRSQLMERESRAKEEGMTDPLTQLLNRRGWEARMREVERQCARENLNAAVIVIDLDGLKRINDTLGHTQGDVFIKRAGTALRIASRREDVLARLGGDEFAYLSVGCQPEQAGAVVQRLSQALQNAQVPASLGYAMRDLAGSLQAAFKEADESMYAHKRERKARTVQATKGLTA